MRFKQRSAECIKKMSDGVDIVRKLLALGHSKTARNNKGELPLHSACFALNFGAIELLVDNDTINALTNDGKTPLDYVFDAYEENPEKADQVLVFLMKKGATTGDSLKQTKQ